MKEMGNQVHQLLEENKLLFGSEEKGGSKAWMNYVDYIDSIVAGALLSTVGCRFGPNVYCHPQ